MFCAFFFLFVGIVGDVWSSSLLNCLGWNALTDPSTMRFPPDEVYLHCSHVWARPESERYALHRSRCVTLYCCLHFVFLCCSFHPAPLVRNWTPVLVRKHLARSVPFHTVLCNRCGRKGIKIAQATGLMLNINTFPCLSFVGLGSSPGLSAHFWTHRAGWIHGC